MQSCSPRSAGFPRLATALAASIALLLTGCGGSRSVRIDAKPVVELASPLAAPPTSLTIPCRSPAEIAADALSAGAVERLWGEDRASLAACGARYRAMIDFYRQRDAGLAGQKPPS